MQQGCELLSTFCTCIDCKTILSSEKNLSNDNEFSEGRKGGSKLSDRCVKQKPFSLAFQVNQQVRQWACSK